MVIFPILKGLKWRLLGKDCLHLLQFLFAKSYVGISA